MEKKARVKICPKCWYWIPVWSEFCLRCNKPDLDSIKTNAKINSTLKNTEQEESEATNMKVPSKQQSVSKTRKGAVKKSLRAGRRIKNK
jgi:hypothetical protein